MKRILKVLSVSMILGSAFEAQAEVGEAVIASAKSVRLTRVEQVRNESLNKFFQNAREQTPWIYRRVWGCFGNFFSTSGYTYSASENTELEAIALKVAYGGRGINLDTYVKEMSPKGTTILEKNKRTNSALLRQLTGHTRQTKETSQDCKDARVTLKAMIASLDKSLQFATSNEESSAFDMDVDQTVLIDTENHQAIVISVGDADIPDPPNE